MDQKSFTVYQPIGSQQMGTQPILISQAPSIVILCHDPHGYHILHSQVEIVSVLCGVNLL